MKKTLVCLAFVLAPATLAAQAPTTYSTYVASDGTVAGAPTVVGATVGWEIGYAGVRVGLGLDSRTVFSSDAQEESSGPDGLVNTDVDMVALLRNPRNRDGLMPYAVGGLGLRSVRDEGDRSYTGIWTAGGGVRARLFGPMTVEGEARYVQPLSEPEYGSLAPVRKGIELRASLRLGLGSRMVGPVRPPVARPNPPPLRVRTSAVGNSAIVGALAEAERHLGVSYLWGGNTPQSGFDCSGFVRWVYRQQGIDLPRVSQDQARVGVAIPLEISAFQPGDLLAFATRGTVDHIAIYAGDGFIIHASSSGGEVRYDDLNSPRGDWYRRHMVAARRVVTGSGLQVGGR
jgi:hypothetical protein